MTTGHVSGTRDDDCAPAVDRAIQLLKEALLIFDSFGAPPQIGARLEELIGEAQELK